MIFHPKIGQEAVINYKDKSMPNQGKECEIVAVGKGPGPRNVMVIIVWEIFWWLEVVPRGNLNAIRNYKQSECICGEINSRNCPVHQ